MSKTLFIKTYGCQMNVYDSARMVDVMAAHGYRRVSAPASADVVILNTCHIREIASEKLFSELGRLRRHKSERAAAGEDTIIAVAGCVAQAEGGEIVRRAPWVDVVVGPQTYHRLPRLVARARARAAGGLAALVDTEFPLESKFDHLPEESASQGASAYLTVQEGCDKFCAFCVVPYTRGAESSRPVGEVLAEARRMVAAGAREIVLLGQNVNAYHGAFGAGELGLGGLIRRLDAIEGLERIRYTTSHPSDVDDDLVLAHRDVERLMPFLHLPIQSGSDRVLLAMNRRYRRDDYRRTVERLRRARPDLALASDFIVGFPGESDSDFEQTLALVRDVGFAQAYSFKYSPRSGTPAAAAEGQVPDDVKSERLARLQALIGAEQARYNALFVGTVLDVLFDRAGRYAGQVHGRSPHMQSVHLAGPDRLLGTLRPVRITRSGPNSLAGVLHVRDGRREGRSARPVLGGLA